MSKINIFAHRFTYLQSINRIPLAALANEKPLPRATTYTLSVSFFKMSKICIVHNESVSGEEVRQLSSKTFSRIRDFASIWQTLDELKACIAKSIVGNLTDDSVVSSAMNFGFHQICYNRFTDRRTI